MSTVYGIGQFNYSEDEPEDIALEFFQSGDTYGSNIIQVQEGEKYIPTNQDEIDGMIGEDWTFLVKNIKPYKIYGYDEKSDSVYEIDISQVKDGEK